MKWPALPGSITGLCRQDLLAANRAADDNLACPEPPRASKVCLPWAPRPARPPRRASSASCHGCRRHPRGLSALGASPPDPQLARLKGARASSNVPRFDDDRLAGRDGDGADGSSSPCGARSASRRSPPAQNRRRSRRGKRPGRAGQAESQRSRPSSQGRERRRAAHDSTRRERNARAHRRRLVPDRISRRPHCEVTRTHRSRTSACSSRNVDRCFQ